MSDNDVETTKAEVGGRTVAVASYHSPVEANIARTRLEEHDIPCRLDNEMLVGNGPVLGATNAGVRLMVREENAQAAAELLSQSRGDDEDSMLDFDWDAEDFGDEDDSDGLVASGLSCPECGSENIGFGGLFHLYWSLVILVVVGPIFIPHTSATAWLGDLQMFALPTGVFIGMWLAIFRLFPLACKDCGKSGMRKVFMGNRE